MMQMKVIVIFKILYCKAGIVYNSGLNMFVLFNAGQPMTGQRMFESDEEDDD